MFCSVANAATYYVATNGNDTSGDGSTGTPWLTFAKAATVLTAGSIITHKWRSNVTGGTIKIYKGINAVPYTTVTDIRGFGGLSGVNAIQLNTNDSFFEKAQDYTGIVVDANSGGSILDLIIFSFSIENRSTPSTANIETVLNSLGDQVEDVSEKIDNLDGVAGTGTATNGRY